MAKLGRHVEVFKASSSRKTAQTRGRVVTQAWYFRLVAANGRKADRSAQPYVSKWSARRGAMRAHPGLTIIDK